MDIKKLRTEVPSQRVRFPISMNLEGIEGLEGFRAKTPSPPMVLVLLIPAGCPFQSPNKFPEKEPLSGDGIARFRRKGRRGRGGGRTSLKNRGSLMKIMPPLGRREGGIEEERYGEREGGSARRKLHGKSQSPPTLKEAFPCCTHAWATEWGSKLASSPTTENGAE